MDFFAFNSNSVFVNIFLVLILVVMNERAAATFQPHSVLFFAI